MITGRMTPIQDADDLVGRYWVCPHCQAEIKITEDGISHGSNKPNKHWQIKDLQMIWDEDEAIKAWEKKERDILFGR